MTPCLYFYAYLYLKDFRKFTSAFQKGNIRERCDSASFFLRVLHAWPFIKKIFLLRLFCAKTGILYRSYGGRRGKEETIFPYVSYIIYKIQISLYLCKFICLFMYLSIHPHLWTGLFWDCPSDVSFLQRSNRRQSQRTECASAIFVTIH